MISTLLVLALALTSRIPQSSAAALTPVRVAFLTDCKWYSDWQSIGMIFSFKRSGQPGRLTRVMCCSDEDKAKYPAAVLTEVDTHIAPSFGVHPVTHDNYVAYNKPEAVIDWLQHVTPEEQYILVLDSDMILRRPFLVEVMKPRPGLAVGAKYTYMIGVNNELALRHVPEVVPRNDTLAGPYGRRGDQVGGFFFIHRDDLKRMSTLWLKYTEDVRADPMAYKYSGDVYAVNPGDKPWISEMYGYAFGAAKADVWHTWDPNSMIYPEYEPHDIPKLMHYGLLFKVGNYKFDKHWHYGFDINKCPPWDLADTQHRVAGLFAEPPHFSTLTNQDQVGLYFRDLLSIETVATLNAGLCDFHVRHCPPSDQLYKECKKASDFYNEITKEVRRLESTLGCTDLHVKCPNWAEAGECTKNREYMEDTCKKSCGVCHSPAAIEGLAPVSDELERNLEELGKKLQPGGGGGGMATDPDTAAQKGKGKEVVDPDAASKGKAVVDPDAANKGKAVVDPDAVRKGSGGADPDAKAASASPAAASPVPSPVVAVASPVAVPSPVAHPAASPIVIQPSPLPSPKEVVAKPSPSTVSTKSRKELVVACYRMPLTLDEVKDCVKAAQEGVQYERRGLKAGSKADSVDAKADAGESKDSPLTGPRLGGLQNWQIMFSVLLLSLVFLFVVRRLLGLRRRPKSGMRTE